MSRVLARSRTLIYPDYGMFQIVNCDGNGIHMDDTAGVPGRDLFSAGDRSVFVGSLQSSIDVTLDLESWDTEPDLDSRWDGHYSAVIDMDTGVVGVNEITAGGQSDLLVLPAPGTYRIRVYHRGRRETAEAYSILFARYDDVDSPEFEAEEDALKGREHYLAQFWPVP